MKKTKLRETKIHERRKGDFTTSKGGSGFIISNNPLAKGTGGG